MTPQEIGLMLANVILSSLGQLLLKTGALKLGKVTTENAVSHILHIVLTPELVGGLLSYALGAVAYIFLLTRVKLSIAAPAASLIYLFSVLFGYFIFNESISLGRSIGLGLILCGVVLVVAK